MFSILLDYIFIHVLTNTWQVRLRVHIFIYIHEHRIITFSPLSPDTSFTRRAAPSRDPANITYTVIYIPVMENS